MLVYRVTSLARFRRHSVLLLHLITDSYFAPHHARLAQACESVRDRMPLFLEQKNKEQ